MADRSIRNDDRMSDLEALMWTLDKDPHLSSNFACLTMLDSTPDVGQLRVRLDRATRVVPQLRRRVLPALARMAPPNWTDDVSFDINHHVRAVALPAPGSSEQLHSLAATLAADPFDRSRPLWEFVVIEGLADGGAAMLWKLHHTISDGVGGIRMSEQFLDLERDATQPPELEPPRPPDPEPTFGGNAADTIRHNIGRSMDTAGRLTRGTIDVAMHPKRLGQLGPEVVGLIRSLVRQAATPLRPSSPLWRDRSLRHGFETLSVPFDDARTASAALGGSINDFFVAGAGAAVARFHSRHGEPIDFARMAMPVSTRTDRSAGGNSFAPLRLKLPLHVDPVEQFALVHELLETEKSDAMIGAVEGMAGALNLLPTSLLVRVARTQAEAIDFATSNVRAAPFPLYVAGARLEATHPIGPLAGSAFNLTLMSYNGSLDMGLHVDLEAIDDPSELRDLLEGTYSELIDAGR